MRPWVTKQDSTHTGQCEASGGETSQMWQKNAVPRPLSSVYFGVNVNNMPNKRLGSRFGAAWLRDVRGSSRPHLNMSVSALGDS